MTLTPVIFLLISSLAFVCEFIDAGLGMGYGTIITPLLILGGLEPATVVPAVLLSQACGGLSASVFHHRFANASFTRHSRDSRAALLIAGFGIAATVIGALIAINIPSAFLKTYIGVLVTVMGILILRRKVFTFSWKKMMAVGVISAFNKGLSGGGYGPVVTAGQILAGQNYKAAIGVTTLAEVPICLCGFLTYLVGKNMKGVPVVSKDLLLALLLGAILAGPCGALSTKNFKRERLPLLLGGFIVLLGILTLAKTLSP